MLLFLPDWMDPSDAGTYSPIRCLRAAFRKEENLTHRDFLGSLMGMGIVREKIGDILVGPDSADVLVLDTVAEFLAQSWESAGRVKLRVAEIDPGCVHIPEIRREERRDNLNGWTAPAPAGTAFWAALDWQQWAIRRSSGNGLPTDGGLRAGSRPPNGQAAL